MEQLQVGQYLIQYQIIHKKVKNITMRFDQSGCFVVVCNPYVPKEKIEALLHEKVAWIVEKQAQVKERKSIVDTTSHESIVYLGTRYPITLVESSYPKLQFDQQGFTIYYQEEAHIEKLIANFLAQQSRQVFLQIAQDIHQHFERDYRIPYPTIKIRTMEQKWGTCMPRKQIITLNSKLIHYPKSFIEYVVLHEFAHFIQPNHSKAFYAIIEKYMPDYKSRIIV
ncbi:MAG: M48 family metallopeptidase [Erysipelotrichaceae bacterium]